MIPHVFFVIAAIGFGLLLAAHRALKKARIRHYGDRAERLVRSYLNAHFPQSVVLNNVFLPYKSGSTQVDHILLSQYGIFVIDTKSHNGIIFTGEREWAQRYHDKTVFFHSPLLQNKIHCDALRRLFRKSNEFAFLDVQAVTVFTSRRVRFSSKQDGVVLLKDLNRYIKDHRGAALSFGTVKKLARFLQKNKVKSRAVKRQHERLMRKRHRRRK